MELRPKARKRDVEAYIESCRTKFGCFETGGPGEDLAGKCMPYIHDVCRHLHVHVHVHILKMQSISPCSVA